jgi:hypothetical protein
MATYTLISSNVLASSAASVTFSAIPATYTDLCIRISARTDQAAVISGGVAVKFNSTTSGYSKTSFQTTNSTSVTSSQSSSQSSLVMLYTITGAGAVSSTFGSAEMYIPSYAASQNKPSSFYGTGEDNTAVARSAAYANLWQDTTAISSINLADSAGGNFVSGSSFYLYGISNA